MVAVLSARNDRKWTLTFVAPALVVVLGTTSSGQRVEHGVGRAADLESVAGAPAGAWSKDLSPPGWIVIETRSYQIQSRLDRETTVALGRHLEELLDLYRALLPSPQRTERLVVKLLADEAEYKAYGGSAGSGGAPARHGHYDRQSGEVVVWNTRLVLGRAELATAIGPNPDRVHTLTFAENQAVLHLADDATLAYTPDLGDVLARWCWRQYVDLRVWPKGAPALPVWLEAGLAEHFAAARADARGRYQAGLNAARVRDLGWVLVQGDARPLAELLGPAGDAPAFDVGPAPPAQGWSIVHFLLTSDEAGRRELLPRLLAETASGGSYEKARSKAVAGLDFERLQSDWQVWAGSLHDDDPLGELARRFGDKLRPEQMTGDDELEARYRWLWNRRRMPQPGGPP